MYSKYVEPERRYIPHHLPQSRASAMEANDSQPLSLPEPNQGEASGGGGPWILTSFLSTLLLLTACTLTASARAFRAHVEVAHPVYAVLMQECIVLALMAWAAAALVIASLSLPDAKMLANDMIPLAGSFHQVSWLVVSALRYTYHTYLVCEDVTCGIPSSNLLPSQVLFPHLRGSRERGHEEDEAD